ncbi:hypothetical protein UFOVP134_11 [uncultured Caudovirales phage]|uniref:dATP/dGTP diphosphohydrolase N-terminal domain-containing protein n=1 Tax=uncultured Caudovirales phage TaxID=2100421 RepID=A0A6J5LBS7_9CAUD|nr:hypothetical protein UFOVP134_11 [uncultured Caudovirales phage]
MNPACNCTTCTLERQYADNHFGRVELKEEGKPDPNDKPEHYLRASEIEARIGEVNAALELGMPAFDTTKAIDRLLELMQDGLFIEPEWLKSEPGETDRKTSLAQKAAAERKATPIASGVIAYFPDALAEVARVSRIGNEQHHPGQSLHWDKSKSADELDALSRHLTDRLRGEVFDTDGARHLGKVAWRALAALQREIDAESDLG